MTMQVAFIGFGEVASVLSERMLQRGCPAVSVYDVLLDRENGLETLRGRSRSPEVRFADLTATIAEADYVLSTVVTQVAVPVAERCAKHLRPGQVYVDLNSTAPAVKVEVGGIVSGTGATFVEGAVLGAIGATGADTAILLGGEGAETCAAALAGLGLRASAFSREVGKASTYKMLRSIATKGLEALLVELLLAGRSAGLDRELWQDVLDTVAATPFDRTASNWVQTHGAACERRFHEMEQVVETMVGLGVEPTVTRGTLAMFQRSAALGLNGRFPGKARTVDEVVDALRDLTAQA